MRDQGEPVSIRLESRSDGEALVQNLQGYSTIENGEVVLRYAEPDRSSLGSTMTVLSVNEERIRIERHGDVSSLQLFSKEGREDGYYRLADGDLSLQTKTRSMTVRLQGGTGLLNWTYELYIMGEFAGFFELRLDIQEGHH